MKLNQTCRVAACRGPGISSRPRRLLPGNISQACDSRLQTGGIVVELPSVENNVVTVERQPLGDDERSEQSPLGELGIFRLADHKAVIAEIFGDETSPRIPGQFNDVAGVEA